MNYWEMLSSGACETFLPQTHLYQEINARGVSTEHVRAVLAKHFSVESPRFEVLIGGERGSGHAPDVDFMTWNWIPICSTRAVQTLIKSGAVVEDFVECVAGGRPRYLHLPQSMRDVVDLDRSVFRMMIPIPGERLPLPHRIERLLLRHDTPECVLPGCFRPANRFGQCFSELVVGEGFKLAWEDKGLTGATFRLLT